MTFAAYFDESGTHEGSPLVTVAGYLSTVDRWEAFERDWRKALAPFPFIEQQFHMTDFSNNAPPYNQLSRQERKALLNDLLAAINTHVIGSIAVSVPEQTYQAAFNAQADKLVGGSVGLASFWAAMKVGRILGLTGVHGRVAYIFEDKPGKGRVATMFGNVRTRNPVAYQKAMRTLSYSFQGKELVSLQAADLLAYEVNRRAEFQLGLSDRPLVITQPKRSHLSHEIGLFSNPSSFGTWPRPSLLVGIEEQNQNRRLLLTMLNGQ